jgi:hypothetical protein
MHRRPGPASFGGSRARSRRLAALSALVFAAAACGPAPDVSLKADLTLYGRNAAGGIAWFLVRPVSRPIQSVGFGTDGVACLIAQVGSELVMTDRSGEDGSVIRIIGSIDHQRETRWVDSADGGFASGDGVPSWWVGDTDVCPAAAASS